jgi:RNA polymerase sigma factor (sigma-70 family)
MGASEKQSERAAAPAGPAWQQYGHWLQRYLARCLRHHDSASAQDLAQEVYLRLLRVGKGEPVRNYQAYLYRIASHVVYEFKLRARREIVSFDSEAVESWDEHSSVVTADPIGEHVSAEREVDRALAQLHPLERTILLLQKRDGLEYTEIARELGMSVNMVHKHLTRALAALRAARWNGER